MQAAYPGSVFASVRRALCGNGGFARGSEHSKSRRFLFCPPAPAVVGRQIEVWSSRYQHLGTCHFDEHVSLRVSPVCWCQIKNASEARSGFVLPRVLAGVGTFKYMDRYATASVSEKFCRLLDLHPALVLRAQTINSVIVGGRATLTTGPRSPAISETLESAFEIVRNDDGSRVAGKSCARSGY